MTTEKLYVFDTTLRDGEQAAGSAISHADKVRIAAALEAAGVDVIEAGFAASSESAFSTIEEIAHRSSTATICALARGNKADIKAAGESVAAAGKRGRIHVFIATDKKHMEIKLGLQQAEVLQRIADSVSYAKSFVDDVEFSPEVATTTDFDFLVKSVHAATMAGATVINIADTTGHCFPWEYGALIANLRKALPGLSDVVLSAHCHNDRGCATANTLAGIQAGVRQVECTINGIGERAGNTALEEVLMAVTLRPEQFGVHHTVVTQELCELSRMVEKASAQLVPANKAFVGRNAFAHESGIHQDGVLKDASLYEVCDPALVGATQRLPLGMVSGRSGVAASLSRLGYHVSEVQLNILTKRVKEHASTHRHVDDEALCSLADELLQRKH